MMRAVREAAIPFNRPTTAPEQQAYVAEALRNGRISGDGPFTTRCQRLLEEVLPAHRVLLTTSCTHALELAAMLLDVGPDDEVIVPSFTFVSTANAFAIRGARIVFSDVLSATFTLDPDHVRRLVSTRTRAIVPVHYASVACEMDEIGSIAAECGASVVEDNAHGLFGSYRDRELGTIGQLGALSFHDTKNFTCGEGGALIVNDPAFAERAEILREKGTDRSRFFRGEVDKYTWVDVGSSYLPSDILAAVLLAQLEDRARIQAQREALWTSYVHELADWASERGVRLPVVPAHCHQAFHMFFLVMPDHSSREGLIGHLRERGVLAVFHYLPLHRSPAGRRFGVGVADCPTSDWISERIVRLPFFTDMTDHELEATIAAVRSF
jgi:dTDP-4-amino-4,6-dideoxygalactose transaminase